MSSTLSTLANQFRATAAKARAVNLQVARHAALNRALVSASLRALAESQRLLRRFCAVEDAYRTAPEDGTGQRGGSD